MSAYEERLAQIAQDTVVAAVWDETLHPRGRDGKFIEKGGWIRGIFKIGNSFKKLNGRVLGFQKNDRWPKDPLVVAMTSEGELTVPVSQVTEVAEPKANILHKVLGKNPTKEQVDSLFSKKMETFDQALKRVNAAAEKLSTTDPQERAQGLDKIMGGVRGSPMSTVVRENKRGKSRSEWDAQRVAQHEQLWAEFLARVEEAGVPKERKALALGGLPGAGKSWSLRPGEAAGELGVVAWEAMGDPPPDGVTHVVLNPDNMKELMIRAGMLPAGVSDKIKPREQVSFIHAESNFLTALFFERMAELGYNVVYDTTMANVPHIKKNLGPLRDAGYTFQGLFVDIDRQESRISSTQRYFAEWDTPMGGRFVPSEAGASGSGRGFKSYNRDVFQDMTEWFDDGWLVVDNTGVSRGEPRGEITARGAGLDEAVVKYRQEQERLRKERAAASKAKFQQSQQSFLDMLDKQEALSLTAKYAAKSKPAPAPTPEQVVEDETADLGGIDDTELDDLIADYEQDGVKIDLRQHSVTGNWILSRLIVPEQGAGVGTQFMEDLTALADELGKTIALTPSTDFGATSKARLVTFYKRFGFVENRGGTKDFTISESMYREPRDPLIAAVERGRIDRLPERKVVWMLRSGTVTPEDVMGMLTRGEVFVADDTGNDEDDYLTASTLVHQMQVLGRDDLIEDIHTLIDLARQAGLTMDAYTEGLPSRP